MKIVARQNAQTLRRLVRSFPAVLLYGPRQCGKSTLVRHLFPEWTLLDLERPADFAQLSSDIEGMLEANPRHLVIDEAQRLPELFPVLRYMLDKRRGNGQVILLGSASPALIRNASETLAGRIALHELAPFSAFELHPLHRDPWFWGGYPPVYERRDVDARVRWLDSYVSTYLERDLPALGLRLPSRRVRTLWTMLTHVHGRPLNVSDLARSLAVSSHTVGDYIDVLESTFMIRRLPPYHANVQKRLSKSPKLYLRDTGLLHFLAGLRTPGQLSTWPQRGSSFEGMVIEELCRWTEQVLVRPEIAHWRTAAGGEVDLLIGDGNKLLPVEVKMGSVADPRGLAGLRGCMEDLGLSRGWVVTQGGEQRALGRGIEIVPWRLVVERKIELGLGQRAG